jgi:acylphosphatase
MRASRLKCLILVLALMAGAALAADDKTPVKPVGRMVYYTGKVQGVGFRATAVDIARDYPVTGWVKNLADGRVQLLAEGPQESVEAFLKAIRTHWKDNIENEQVAEQKVSGKYTKFDTAE